MENEILGIDVNENLAVYLLVCYSQNSLVQSNRFPYIVSDLDVYIDVRNHGDLLMCLCYVLKGLLNVSLFATS